MGVNINTEFYNEFMFKSLEWLLKNENKINEDFNTHLEELEFYVINSNLDERVELILGLKRKGIEDFSKYITSCPFQNITSKFMEELKLKFDLFKSIHDDYQAILYFDRIRRK